MEMKKIIVFFDEAIEIIKKSIYTVYAVDSRGHGQSDKVLEYHYLDMAKDIQEMIEQLELKRYFFNGK